VRAAVDSRSPAVMFVLTFSDLASPVEESQGHATDPIYAAREDSPEPAIENRDTRRAELTPTSTTTLPA
jgi:hypothetical protein